MRFSEGRDGSKDVHRSLDQRGILSFSRGEHEFQFAGCGRELILHISPTPGAILTWRERDVILAHQERRHEPQLRERQVLSHTSEASNAEGGEGALVGDHFRHRVPPLGHELGGTGKGFVDCLAVRNGISNQDFEFILICTGGREKTYDDPWYILALRS